MKWDVALRGIGIVGVVAAYAVYKANPNGVTGLLIAITAILSLVGPEVVSSFPYGPSKDD